MRLQDSFTSVRIKMPGRRVALASLVIAVASAGASLAFGSPLSQGLGAQPEFDWLPWIGGALPLLAMTASALSLFGGAKPVPEGPSPALLAEVQDLVHELTEAMAGQRVQVAALQRSCEAAMKDAAAASARMGRVADAAIDAETRLTEGVARAEKAMRQPAAIVSLAAEATQRVEKALPELADSIRTSLMVSSDPIFNAAAERLSVAVDSAVRTFRDVIDDATTKLASLNDISTSLRRDAVALDMAGREIATAGATVVARANETVNTVDTALADLPAAVASVTAAAEQLREGLTEASNELRMSGAALQVAGEQANQAAESFRASEERVAAERVGIEAAADRIGSVIAQVDAVRMDALAMASLTERLREAWDALAEGSQSLERAGLRAACGIEAAWQNMCASGEKVAEIVASAIAPLPVAAAAVSEATDMLAEASAMLCADSAKLQQIGNAVAERCEAASGELAERAVGAMETVSNAAEQAGHTLAEASAVLSADSAALEASGRETAQAAASLAREAEMLRESVTEADRDVINTVVQNIEAVTARLETEAGEVRRDLGNLNLVASMLEQAAAKLPEVDGLAGRLQGMVASLPMDISERIGAVLPKTLPEMAARMEAAIPNVEYLESLSRRLEALGERLEAAIPASLPETAKQLDALSERLAGIGERLGAARLPETAAQLEAAVPRLELLDALANRLDTIGARIEASVPSSLPETVARLEAVAPRIDHLDALGERLATIGDRIEASIPMGLPETAARLEAAAPRIEHLDALGERLATIGDRIEASIPMGLPETAARLEAAAPRIEHLDALGERLATIGDRIDASIPTGLSETAARLEAVAPRIEQLDALGEQFASLGERIEASIPTGLPGVAERLEAAAPWLDQLDLLAGRMTSIADQIESSIPAGLLEATARLEASAPKLAHLDALGVRLETIAARLPSELAGRIDVTTQHLPDTTARLEAAGARLERMDAMIERIEAVAHRLPANDTTAAALAALSGDIGDSVRRVHAALADHDGTLASLITSLDRVQAAVAEVRAASTEQDLPQDTGTSLDETLDHLDGVAAQTEALLRRAEGLAEAVMRGEAPGVSLLLADRAPSLLAGVEAAVRRLRSVATALALASDGPERLRASH